MTVFENVAVAVRQIQKNKVFASIIIFALSIGTAACLLIFQYASYELSFDRHNPNFRYTYRVNMRMFENNIFRYETARTPKYVLREIRERIPGIDASVRFNSTMSWFDCAFTYREGNKSVTFNERKVSYAEPAALDLFQYKLIKGDKGTALTKSYTALVSLSTSQKYFGLEEPVGKVLHLYGSGENHEYTIVGVFEDQALNTHFTNDILLSSPSATDNFGFSYVVINDHTSLQSIQEKLVPIATEFRGDPGQHIELTLEPVSNIHLYSTAEDGPSPTTDPIMMYFLLGIAFVVLALAWINYVNLGIARSFARAKEIGIRKAAGATYRNVVNQFLTETFVYNALSLGIALVLVAISARWFYEFVGISFPWDKLYWLQLGVTGWIIVAVFFGGILLSGVLPARMLAAIPTILVLRGKLVGIHGGIGIRRLLVVCQFICTISLLMAVNTANRQFHIMKDKNPGVDFRRTVVIKSPSNSDSTFRVRLSQLKSSLQNHSIADKVFTSSEVFTELNSGWSGIVHRQRSDGGTKFYISLIDPDFIKGAELNLLAGRDFAVSDYPGKHFGDKIEPLIINQTGINRLGFKSVEAAIGAAIYWEDRECQIVGVIDDFHQFSVKYAVVPMIYTANNGPSLTVQLTSSAHMNLSSSLAIIKKEWDSYFPENAFEYSMGEDVYDSLYQAEEQTKSVFQFFCVLAIIISCLGLYALSLFSLTRRTKEISIRKVLGAPRVHLLGLLTHEYIMMIFIAALIAFPVSWMALENWLDGFELRVSMNVASVAVPVILVFIFSFVSISFQTIQVLKGNPVNGLKGEI